jgi:hypothetical protein
MLQDRWKAYLAYRMARVRARIAETERLMRPPTPEELVALQHALQRLREQEAQLTRLVAGHLNHEGVSSTHGNP